MPTLDTLTERDFRNSLSASTLKKAYPKRNAVLNPTRTGDTLRAQVQGSTLYEVEVTVNTTGIAALCTCHYNWGGYCKHVGAVLLRWLEAPQTFTVQTEAKAVPDAPIRLIPASPPPTTQPPELPAWLQKPLTARQAADRALAANLLMQLRLDDLRSIARERGWTIKGTRKDMVIDQLLERMTDASETLKALHKLDNEHRQVLWAVALLGNATNIRPEDVERISAGWGTLKRYSKVDTYLRHLAEAGLLSNLLNQPVYDLPLLTLPRLWARHYPPLPNELLPTQEKLTDNTAATGLQSAEPGGLARIAFQMLLILEQAPTPLRDPLPRPYLERYHPNLRKWDYVAAELKPLEDTNRARANYNLMLTVPPPQSALPPEANARLKPVVGDVTRVDFLYRLLLAAGLLLPGSPTTVWPEVKAEFLRQSEAQQWATLVRVYFRSRDYSEVWDVIRANPSLQLVRAWGGGAQGMSPELLYDHLTAFRQLVLNIFAWLPDNVWIKVTDLLALLRRVWPQFDAAVWTASYWGSGYSVWYLSKNGAKLAGEADWQLAQGNFILTMLRGPLHWLGLVDLYTDGETLQAVRFHGLADLYLDRSETVDLLNLRVGTVQTAPAQKMSATALTVKGDQILVNPTTISAAAHSLLDRIARLDLALPQQFTYLLDAAVVHKTFEAGGTLEELEQGWREHFAKPMPAALQSRLQQWWNAYGRVRLYNEITVIEFSDNHALLEMKAVTSLNKVLIAELSPRLVMIPKDAVQTLTAELEKAGYTPQVSEDEH